MVAELERRGLSATLSARSAPSAPARTASFRTVALDITVSPANAFRLLGEPDTLIHLAWGGLPNYKAAHHIEVELPAQFRFLSRLVEDGLGNLLVAGTCLEYGMQAGALHEELETKPTTPYGVAKDALRKRLQSLQARTPFNLTWARLFYSYGDGQSPGSLLPQLRRAVERGDATFRMSGGEQQRDYLPAAAVASCLVHLASTENDNGIVNVCSGKPATVRALVEGWVRDNNWPVTLELGHYPYPDYEPMAFWGDPTKLNRCLAMQPTR